VNKQIHELSVVELLHGLEDKRFSSSEIVKHYLDRIEKYNSELNIYLHVNEKALGQAQKVDEEIKKNGLTKPLQGIPVAIKDNFLTVGLPTTASSLVLEDYYSQYESTVTRRLLDAGAIILGKTNMDAWAHGSSTESSQYGPTLNPWDLGRLPGGSSGGSAAAIAAQLAPIAIGSETSGSIRQPAAWCGVTGFKGSYGRVSRYGVIAMASSTDSPGPIARSVEDAALITSVIAGLDKYDATTSPRAVEPYHQLLKRKDLKGMKIALVKDYLLPSMRTEVKTLIHNAARHLESLGAIVEEISLMDPKYSIGVYTVLQRSEVSSNLARYDGVRFGHSRQSFGPEAKRRIILGTFCLSSGYYDAYYLRAMKVRTMIKNDFDEVFKDVDIILTPTSPSVAFKIGEKTADPLQMYLSDIFTISCNLAGICGISIPCGFSSDNLPIGLQLLGKPFDEKTILKAGHNFQKQTNHHLKTPNV